MCDLTHLIFKQFNKPGILFTPMHIINGFYILNVLNVMFVLFAELYFSYIIRFFYQKVNIDILIYNIIYSGIDILYY